MLRDARADRSVDRDLPLLHEAKLVVVTTELVAVLTGAGSG